MQRLGLNPTEQEVVDIPNEIARKGGEIVTTIRIVTIINVLNITFFSIM